MGLIKKPKAKKLVTPSKEPVWKGPIEQGITQSLIGSWLCCRERARIYLVEGLAPHERFVPAIEYGNYWHTAEEAYNAGEDWKQAVKEYASHLCKEYRTEQKDVLHWYNVFLVQFPIYLKFWEDHEDENKKPIFQEREFCVPYKLKASGRIVKLLGKIDGADELRNKTYMQENKTKGDVDEQSLGFKLTFELQTMFYTIALKHLIRQDKLKPFGGIRYNVIKRPLSGGKGSIRPHKEKRTKNTYKPAETMEQFYERLGGVIEENQEEYFKRLDIDISNNDVKAFEVEFLQPVLEQICDWWDEVTGKKEGYSNFRLPYGLYNPLMDGRYSEVENYVQERSTVGLRRVTKLFPELEEANKV